MRQEKKLILEEIFACGPDFAYTLLLPKHIPIGST